MFETNRPSGTQVRLGHRQLLVSMVMLAALSLLWNERLSPPSMSASAAEAQVDDAASEAPTPASKPKRPSEKQIKAYSGLAALVGIIICGLALSALIILWAGRLRRQLRRPLPNGDHSERDFWFLKPPKPTVTQSSLPDAHQPPHTLPEPPEQK